MANNNDINTQVIEPDVTNENSVAEAAVEVPAVKTKKELKKERKEIKKHKKEVKKEAKKHSAKATRAYKVLVTVISLIVIASMIACSYFAITITMGIAPAISSGDDAQNGDNGNSSSSSSTPSNTPSSSTPSSTPSNSDKTEDSSSAAGDNGASGDANATTVLGSKAEVVEYYKTAHAKVLSEAKSVTRTYDNTTNYEGYLEVGGNSTLASVAQTLMDMFMKENTEPQVFSGSDIATNFPPTKNSCAGLTADMIGDYSVEESGNDYVITLKINSSKENPDLGEMSGNLVNIVESKTVEDAAAGFVSFTGLENRYFAPTLKATIDKDSGKISQIDIDTPSNMCFESATAMKIIKVNNVGLGLEYVQTWTVQW